MGWSRGIDKCCRGLQQIIFRKLLQHFTHFGVLGGVHIYAFAGFETGCSKVVLVKRAAAVAVGENDIDFEMNVLRIKHHE